MSTRDPAISLGLVKCTLFPSPTLQPTFRLTRIRRPYLNWDRHPHKTRRPGRSDICSDTPLARLTDRVFDLTAAGVISLGLSSSSGVARMMRQRHPRAWPQSVRPSCHAYWSEVPMITHNNPYDVSSNIKLIAKHATCACCKARFVYKTYEVRPEERTTCNDCVDHDRDGTLDQQVAALVEHEPRLRKAMNDARRAANRLEGERNSLRSELVEQKRKVSAALDTRNRWRKVVDAVLDEHSEALGSKNCSCGASFPCPTTRAAKEADPGISYHVLRGQSARFAAAQRNRERGARYYDDLEDEIGE